jgi:hypothetical protein
MSSLLDLAPAPPALPSRQLKLTSIYLVHREKKDEESGQAIAGHFGCASQGGPCLLLKLRWIGTQRVQMKGVLPWLVRQACCAGSALAALVGPIYKIFFSSPCTISIPGSPSPSKLGW